MATGRHLGNRFYDEFLSNFHLDCVSEPLFGFNRLEQEIYLQGTTESSAKEKKGNSNNRTIDAQH